MSNSSLFAESFDVTSPLDWLPVIISVLVFGPLLIGCVLMVRDTIRQRGKWGINFRRASCTECGEPMPLVRRPANFQEMLWGGWTCSECGFELDKWGKPVESQKTLAKFAVLKAQREADRREGGHLQKPDEGIRGESSKSDKQGG